MRIFHWGLLLRYMVYGVIPLVVGLILLERVTGGGFTGVAVLLLAFLLPFIAIGWLAYQHWRHRRR